MNECVYTTINHISFICSPLRPPATPIINEMWLYGLIAESGFETCFSRS